jgi:hypothetical protein
MWRLDSLLLAGVGVLLAHQVAYGLSTFVGYETSVAHAHFAVAWLAGSLAVLCVLARSITRSLRRRSYLPSSVHSLSGAIALGYTGLEFAERLVGGLGATSLFSELVFWLGVALAPLLASMLHWSVRTIERFASVIIGSPQSQSWPATRDSSLRATSIDLLSHAPLSFVVSPRGPPNFLHS